jgi:spore maturation protein CgeB
MRFVFYYHSLISDWNHDNAHFLRGIAKELQSRGHQVSVYESADGWSLQNLIREQGAAGITEFTRAFPRLQANLYTLANLNLDEVLDGADVVIVHEWNDYDLVKRLGEHRVKNNYRLLFHDTHHRSITDPPSLSKYALGNYDGILARGEIIRECYSRIGWGKRAWTWHEAADTTLFRPVPPDVQTGDIVWIGNWGDDERAAEINDFFVRPVNTLGLRADVYGVRYPLDAVKSLERASVAYRGWLPNHRVPETLCRYGLTLNISRRWYTQALPGIPAIGVFEALACAIPLVCSYWNDAEGLFKSGDDFLMAQDSNEMTNHLRDLMNDRTMAQSVGEAGLNSILSRHTCGHRVDELFTILREIDEPLIRESGVAHG